MDLRQVVDPTHPNPALRAAPLLKRSALERSRLGSDWLAYSR